MNVTEILVLVFLGLWLVSEILSYVPSISANGVFQLIHLTLHKLAGR